MSECIYLVHHGIKGQKWGVRRYQNPDGSLTPAGYNHYGVGKAKSAYEEARRNQIKIRRSQNSTTGDVTKAENETRFRKREYSDAKAYASLKSKKNISKRQQRFIDSYKKKGLTQKEAEIAAYKREKAEKIAVACLAASAAVAVTYGAYRYADYAFDKTLSTKTVLSRVATTSDAGVRDAFYAVKDRSSHDKARYAGLYAMQMRRGDYGYVAPKVYEKRIGVTSAIKMASPKHAKEIVAKELLKGDNLSKFRSEFETLGRGYPGIIQDLDYFERTGKLKGRLYDQINRALVDRNSNTTKVFYKALRDAGYGAVKDINDAKYSGFRTRLPIIVFDSSKVSVKEVRALTDDEIMKKAKRVLNENAAAETMKSIAPDAAFYAALAGVSTASARYLSSAEESAVVRKYRQEHPNSKLTANQIVRNYYAE